MKITTLIDNVVYDKYLTGEHGFSVFIEDGKEKILFDTGQTGNFIYNAMVLGIDISEVNSVVIMEKGIAWAKENVITMEEDTMSIIKESSLSKRLNKH